MLIHDQRHRPLRWFTRRHPLHSPGFIVEAHFFRGSSSEAGQFHEWFAGKDLVEAFGFTRDIRVMDVPARGGRVTVQPYSWIVRAEDGEFEVYTREAFEAEFSTSIGLDPLSSRQVVEEENARRLKGHFPASFQDVLNDLR